MKKKKRLGAILLLPALLFALGGCLQKEPPVKILSEPIQESTVLSFFSVDSLTGTDLEKYWSDRFSSLSGSKFYVNYEGASYYADEGLTYRELLEKRMQSDLPDDLYIIQAEDVIRFEQMGYWQDLSDLDCIDNLSQAALYQSAYNGKVFSIPLGFTGFGFCWNLDLLEEHDLSVPQNLPEFLQVCQSLKEAGITPYAANKGYSLTVPAMCASGLSQLYASPDREEQIARLNSGQTPFSTYMRPGFEFIAMMLDKGYIQADQALGQTPGPDLEDFLSQDYAFFCTKLGSTELMDESRCPFSVSLTGLPLLENGFIAVYGGETRLSVNPNSRNLDTALEFVEMVGAWEALEQSAVFSNRLSSARDSQVSVLENEKPLGDLLLEPNQIPNQDFSLRFNTWENIRNMCRKLCQGATVDDVCRELDLLQTRELAITPD